MDRVGGINSGIILENAPSERARWAIAPV